LTIQLEQPGDENLNADGKPHSPAPPHLTPHPAVDQWYSNPSLQLLATTESLGWSSLTLFIERHEAMNLTIPGWEDDVFGLLLEGSSGVYTHVVDSGITVKKSIGPQSGLVIQPRHTEIEARADSALTYAIMRFNRKSFSETAAALQVGDPARIELLPTFFFNDPLLYHLGTELANEARNANPFGPLYADSLANSLALYLLRNYSTNRVTLNLSSSRLTPGQVRLIDEYIHTHMDQKISLADLATCLHLSVPHFERMFRATTNRPPYRYLLELRLERAIELIKRTRLPLAEVASQCGFSSQSHFTTHFTRNIGISPARFARGVREQAHNPDGESQHENPLQ